MASESSPLQREQQQQQHPNPHPRTRTRTHLPIRTYHCSFCNQILLASTRDVKLLSTRRGGGAGDGVGIDRAGILPLPRPSEDPVEVDDQAEDEVEVEDAQDQDAQNKSLNKEGSPESPESPAQQQEQEQQQHYTILLSTTAVSANPTIIRRQDGFERRFLIRCGRCRVVCGYVLDGIHFPGRKKKKEDQVEGKEEEDEGAEVVYILPGAVVETGDMMKNTENKVDMSGWEKWEDLVPS